MIAPSSREPVETTDADLGAPTCLVDTEFTCAPTFDRIDTSPRQVASLRGKELPVFFVSVG